MTEESSKWKRVVHAIKELIVSGEWKLGEKLPTYDELEVRFHVSRITLQQVVSQLKRDGYITSRVRQGLFVSQRPPHLTRIGIVVPRDESQVRFWYEVVKTAHVVADQHHRPPLESAQMVQPPDVHFAAAALHQTQVPVGEVDLPLRGQFPAFAAPAGPAEDPEIVPVKIPPAAQQHPEQQRF